MHPIPPIPDGHIGKCHFYLGIKKNRYCKFIQANDSLYCSQHGSSAERIPCPFDPKHTVPQKSLQSHMNKCNSKPIPVPYFQLDCNVTFSHFSKPSALDELKTMSRTDFQKLLMKIEYIYTKWLQIFPIHERVLSHESMKGLIEEFPNGKHYTQQASLIGQIDSIGLLDSECVIEFGCGKAGLSSFLKNAIKTPAVFLLVDKSSFKNKQDKLFAESIHEMKRVTIDIKDLKLDLAVPGSQKSALAVSKHLCGCATDLALVCLSKAKEWFV